MTLRSMTGFAQVKGQVNAQLTFALSLKSVNHRFLDLHFRLPSDEFGVKGEPDLNVVLRMPGAMDSGAEKSADELESAVMARVEEALSRLNEMREEEGRSISTELRARMANLQKAAAGVDRHRSTILRSYSERLQARMLE